MRRSLLVVVLLAALLAPPPAAAQTNVLTLDFRDAPLQAVLQALARAARMNLLVEGSLSGTVTLHLERLTFEQALRLIAAAYRLTYRLQGGVYIVRQLPDSGGLVLPRGAQDLPVQLRAYPLRHARAEEVAAVLSRAVAAFSAAQPVLAPDQALPPSPPAPSPPPPGASLPAGPSYGPQAPAPTAPAAPSRQPPASAAPAAPLPPSPGGGGAPVVVVADESSNSVLVAASVSVHLQVQAVLRALDVPGRAASQLVPPPPPDSDGRAQRLGPHSVAYTVQYADVDQLSKVLSGEVADVRISTDARTRRLVVTGPARAQEAVARLVALLDQPVPQVLMSTRVIELTETASRKLGIQWDWQPQAQVVQDPSGLRVTGDPLLAMLGTITASVEQGQGRVLANPTIATADGRTATINAGTTLYIPITITQAGTTTTTLQTINAGIKLEVTPRIVDSTRLMAELLIEVNSLAGFGPQGFPIINSRSISTTLEVADSAPIVLGGLISDTTTELLRKIPLLGDLPLLGEAFRYRERSRQYSNIVVIIVPRVLMPAGR